MIKFFCDRCGKECKALSEVKIPDEKLSSSIRTKTISVCFDCKKEADEIYDKLTDMHFIMFKDFLKGGANNDR